MSNAEAAETASAQAQKYAQELLQIPEMKEFGAVLKSSAAIELTEAETEYVVSVVKHVFKEHIVLQYEVKNTMPDTVLENVSVVATPSDEEELEEVFILQAERLATDEPGKVYVALRKIGAADALPASTFSNVLKFTSKEIDPTTGEPEESGYEDEYEVSEFELAGSDYVIPTFASNFGHLWEQIGASGEESEETLQLSGVKSIAGTFLLLLLSFCSIAEPKMLTFHRRHRTADQDAVVAAARGNRHSCEPNNAHAEASGQDSQWRPCSGHCSYGLLVQIGCDDQGDGPQRGGGRVSPDRCCSGLMLLGRYLCCVLKLLLAKRVYHRFCRWMVKKICSHVILSLCSKTCQC